MDSKKIEILMKTVELGSFTRASEVVGYTQSGLTHLMDSLEKEIGFNVLERDHNGIKLTEKGRELVPAMREFLFASDNLEKKIQEISQNKSEEEVVRIAAYASVAMHWVPEIFYRYKRICPDVGVDLRMVDNAIEPFELLNSGQADLIFASKQDIDYCNWTPLYNETMYAILPEDYPLKDHNVFPVTEFAGKEFLMPYGKFDLDVYKILDPKEIKMNVKSFMVDDETVIRMVEKGLGVTMMAELMIKGRTKNVLAIPVSPYATRELGMATHIKRKDIINILKLKKCILQYISEINPQEAS